MKGRHVNYGTNEFEILSKRISGRQRQFLRCTHIEPETGRRCIYEKRADRNVIQSKNGNHKHIYDIRSFYQVIQPISKEKEEITKDFINFISYSDISLRKATSQAAIDFINSCIRFGFSLRTNEL